MHIGEQTHAASAKSLFDTSLNICVWVCGWIAIDPLQWAWSNLRFGTHDSEGVAEYRIFNIETSRQVQGIYYKENSLKILLSEVLNNASRSSSIIPYANKGHQLIKIGP